MIDNLNSNILPQNTTIGKKYYLDKNIKEIEGYLVENQYPKGNWEISISPSITPFYIVGKEEESKLPVLDIPYYINIMDKKRYLVTDMRMFVKYSLTMYSMEETVRQRSGFRYLRDSSIWIINYLENPGIDTTLGDYPLVVYSNWIARSINMGAVKLTPLEYISILAVCGLFYKSSLTNENIDIVNIGMYSFKISKLFRIPNKEIDDIVKKIDLNAKTIDGLISNIHKVIEDNKIKYFSPITILETISKTWFGYNKHIYLPIALESRPIWITTLYNCITDNTYKNTILKHITDSVMKTKQKTFITAYEEEIKNNIDI